MRVHDLPLLTLQQLSTYGIMHEHMIVDHGIEIKSTQNKP